MSLEGLSGSATRACARGTNPRDNQMTRRTRGRWQRKKKFVTCEPHAGRRPQAAERCREKKSLTAGADVASAGAYQGNPEERAAAGWTTKDPQVGGGPCLDALGSGATLSDESESQR